MLNPRPSYPFLLLEAVSTSPGKLEFPNITSCVPTASFRRMRMAGNRVTLSDGAGSPASQVNLWRTGRRNFIMAEWTSATQIKATWTFSQAYPCKWELSEYDASKNEVAIETLEIVYEGVT